MKQISHLLFLSIFLASCANPVTPAPIVTETTVLVELAKNTPIPAKSPTTRPPATETKAATATSEAGEPDEPPTPDLPAERMALSDFANVDLSTLPVVDHDGLLALCADVVDNSPLPDPNSVDPVQFNAPPDGFNVVVYGYLGDNIMPVHAVNYGDIITITWAIVQASDGGNELTCVTIAHAPIYDIPDGVPERNISQIAWADDISIRLIMKDDSSHGKKWDKLLAAKPDPKDLSAWIKANPGTPILATHISP